MRNASAADESALADLVSLWQRRRAEGQTATPAELCRDRPELLAELERRVAALERMDGLAGVLHETATLDTSGSPATAPGPAGPPEIPGYEILDELGCGGMGVVYLARDTQLKRLVALKMVLAGAHSSEDSRGRFRAEAEAVARLQHPHVVQVFSWGEQGGLPYLVMEHVAGGGLDRRIAGRPQPPADAARLVMLLARAVHAAHKAEVVHRDLKPANVLLAPAADEPALNTAYGWPKVSDFGLARLSGGSGAQTASYDVLGTPSYMAPEQAAGKTREVGPPADIYSLGAILYELLTGRPPFKGESLLETLDQVRSLPPRPPRELCADIPAELESICLRCLAKAAADRYLTAQALSDDLHRFGEGHAVSRPTAPQRTARPGRRVGWLVAALPVLAGVAALTVALRGPRGGEGGEGGAPVIAAPPAREPFQGWIDVVMSRPHDARRQLLRLHEPAARPLKAGDEVRVETSLNRPAYQYVVWIDTQGKAAPVYPWIEGAWARRPEHEEAVKELHLPEGGLMWPMQPGPAGMETLVLLVREEQLPPDVDLAALLADLGAQTTPDLQAVGWFQNGVLVTGEKDRGPSFKQARASDNPVLRTQQVVQQRVKGSFAYTRAVTFGNEGGR
jgi:hypothetical protein